MLTLDRAVRNVIDFAGCELQDAVPFATASPARVAGLDQRKGVLAPGADAEIVALSPTGEIIRILVGISYISDEAKVARGGAIHRCARGRHSAAEPTRPDSVP